MSSVEFPTSTFQTVKPSTVVPGFAGDKKGHAESHGMPFLATISKNIMFRTVEYVAGRQLMNGGMSSELETNHRSVLDDVLKYEQGCPTKDRPLSMKDGRLSVWHADQMI